jgi:hypothetical protein
MLPDWPGFRPSLQLSGYFNSLQTTLEATNVGSSRHLPQLENFPECSAFSTTLSPDCTLPGKSEGWNVPWWLWKWLWGAISNRGASQMPNLAVGAQDRPNCTGKTGNECFQCLLQTGPRGVIISCLWADSRGTLTSSHTVTSDKAGLPNQLYPTSEILSEIKGNTSYWLSCKKQVLLILPLK